MAGWELQRADDRDGHREDGKIGKDVDARHDVPNRGVVETEPFDGRIPESCDGDAGERKKEAEGDAPADEEAESGKDEFPKFGIIEDASVLQQNRDFGEADCDVVDDDGAVERLFRVNITPLECSRVRCDLPSCKGCIAPQASSKRGDQVHTWPLFTGQSLGSFDRR